MEDLELVVRRFGVDKDLTEIDRCPFTIRPLTVDDGHGYLIEYPDLPGCHSDGGSPEEAIVNGRDAVRSLILSCRKHGDPVPKPNSAPPASDNSG